MALLALLQGAALGLSLAAPPGPVNALIARQAATRGTFGGVRAGLPAPIVDTCYLVLTLLGLATIPGIRAALPWLAAVGALLLVYLAWSIVQPAQAGRQLSGPLAVWAVTLTNPFQYAWWFSGGVSLADRLGSWGIAGFLLAIFGWVFLFSFLVSRGAHRWTWFIPLLELVSADVLLLYAATLGWTAAAGL